MEEEIFQNNLSLNEHLREYGCGILASLHVFSIRLTAEQLNKMYEALLAASAIDKDCTIQWIPFTKMLTSRFEFVGIFNEGYLTKSNEVEVLQFFNPNNGFKHFVAGDGLGRVSWDPIPNSKTVREGHRIGKRIWKRS